MIERILCAVGVHDYIWNITLTEPRLNWQECTRCGHVEKELHHHYERYVASGADQSEDGDQS